MGRVEACGANLVGARVVSRVGESCLGGWEEREENVREKGAQVD